MNISKVSLLLILSAAILLIGVHFFTKVEHENLLNQYSNDDQEKTCIEKGGLCEDDKSGCCKGPCVRDSTHFGEWYCLGYFWYSENDRNHKL